MILIDEHSKIVRSILKRLIPGQRVLAHGSRVNGTPREFSDLDLVVITDIPLDFSRMGDIRDAFSESDLPFKVDISDWSTLSEAIQNNIEENHIVFYAPDTETESPD